MQDHPSAPDRRDDAPPADDAPSRPTSHLWSRRTLTGGLVLGLIVLMTGLTMRFGRIDLLARDLLLQFRDEPLTEELVRPGEVLAPPPSGQWRFADLETHPHEMYRYYFTELGADATGTVTARLVEAFQDLLEIYVQRQGEDDNFTIRVLDGRTGETLERFVLADARAEYEETGEVAWVTIDRMRREQTRRLVDKYVARGVPRSEVMVRWGRANQIREARQRDLPFIEYEAKLTRLMGLSLLASEIGTVETFNQDDLVSPVGARSRYQMMPYLLRSNDIQHYRLQTGRGGPVHVYEEWHPLLTLEPAFTLVRGYTNALGHEVPGISGYHTGPYNIFKIYQLFLTEASSLHTADTSVLDAFMWGLTEGFDDVSSRSSFRTYSRGYFPSIYGALRAMEDEPIDTSLTMRTERVQLRSGTSVHLSELLRALQAADLTWSEDLRDASPYERFRRFNPHIDLPDAADGAIPTGGDVRLVPEVGGAPVRFFLPVGAARALRQAGLDVLDPNATFTFDGDTFALPSASAITDADRAYDALVQDVSQFGFTYENRRELERIVDRFQALYDADPTYFRRQQLAVARSHRTVWRSERFDRLAEIVDAARGNFRPPVQPPEDLTLQSGR